MRRALLLTTFAFISCASTSFAVVPGKSITYEGGGAGIVVFDGERHFNALKKPSRYITSSTNLCKACHPSMFELRKGAARITMKAIYAGRYCGACHNGRAAFDARSERNCFRCHRK